MAAARKKSSTSVKSKKRAAQPPGGPVWDPAAVQPGTGNGPPTPAEEKERAFHATHFTADPRGSAMTGKAPPGASPKHRGGTPPPARSGPADV
jgi:hypothetical protein